MTTTANWPALFPSVPWFQERVHRASDPDHEALFRRLGVTDTTFALRVGERAYRLVFDGFGCTEVAEWTGEDPVDFVIDAPAGAWRELIEHVHEHGHADSAHSLNSLVLTGDVFHLTGDEQLGVDCFYRYNATIQAFLDLAASVPTVYRKAEPAPA
jgi:hypothetical protein